MSEPARELIDKIVLEEFHSQMEGLNFSFMGDESFAAIAGNVRKRTGAEITREQVQEAVGTNE